MKKKLVLVFVLVWSLAGMMTISGGCANTAGLAIAERETTATVAMSQDAVVKVTELRDYLYSDAPVDVLIPIAKVKADDCVVAVTGVNIQAVKANNAVKEAAQKPGNVAELVSSTAANAAPLAAAIPGWGWIASGALTLLSIGAAAFAGKKK